MNKRCIALEVAQAGPGSQRPAARGLSLLLLMMWSATLAGCPSSDPAPPSESPSPATQALPAPALEDMTLPAVESTEDHGGARPGSSDASPLGRATLDGVWVDGARIIQLTCSPGEGCPGWREGTGWKELGALLDDSSEPLLAADARLPADVLAAVVAAAAAGDGRPALLLRSADSSLQALPLRSFPRENGLLNPSSLSYRTTFFRGDLRARRETTEPPPAPGQAIRIRGGAIQIADRCGGIASARLIRRNMATWSACYRMAHERTPGVGGEALLSFMIAADGIPTDARSTSTNLDDPALHRCLEAGVQELSFPRQSPAGEPCPVEWTLRLESRKDMPASPPAPPGAKTPIAVLLTPDGAQLFAVHALPALQTGLNAGLGEGLKKRVGVGDHVVVVANPSIPAGGVARAIAEAMRAGFERVHLATPSDPSK